MLEECKIEQVVQGGTYQYLRIEQVFKPDHAAIRTPDQGVHETVASNLFFHSQLQAQGVSDKHLGCSSIPVLLQSGRVGPPEGW